MINFLESLSQDGEIQGGAAEETGGGGEVEKPDFSLLNFEDSLIRNKNEDS